MGMKASEVGDWLRQRAGKRDHREVMQGDYLVIRPGPNFHLLNPDFPDGLASERHLGAVYRRNSETCTVGSGLIFLSPAAPTAIGPCLLA